jgi:hypothetical protein
MPRELQHVCSAITENWRQTRRKGSEYHVATYPSHILNNSIILNMSTPHMPLFQIGVTFLEYVVWIYSDMSAVMVIDIMRLQSQNRGIKGSNDPDCCIKQLGCVIELIVHLFLL